MMSSNDIASNLIFYMGHVKFHADENNYQLLTLLPTARDVFRGEARWVTVGDATHTRATDTTCLAAESLLDAYSAQLHVRIDLAANYCTPILSHYMGALEDPSVQFDMNTFSFAVAVNRGFAADLITLLAYKRETEPFWYKGVEVTGRYYNAPSFEGMDAIICVVPVDTDNPANWAPSWLPYCFSQIEALPVIPLLSHVNPYCHSCDMSTLPWWFGESFPGECNTLMTDASMITASVLDEDIVVSLSALLDVVSTLTYDEMLRAISPYYGYHDPALETSLFSACKGCIVANLVSIRDAKNFEFTRFGNILSFGHCNNSLPSEAAMQRLAETPPIKLVEDYYECHSTVNNAVLEGIAVAFGNASFFGPILLLILLPIIWALNYIFMKKDRILTYPETELAMAAEELVTRLLEIRDNDSAIEDVENSVLFKLFMDLKHTAFLTDQRDKQTWLKRQERRKVKKDERRTRRQKSFDIFRRTISGTKSTSSNSTNKTTGNIGGNDTINNHDNDYGNNHDDDDNLTSSISEGGRVPTGGTKNFIGSLAGSFSSGKKKKVKRRHRRIEHEDNAAGAMPDRTNTVPTVDSTSNSAVGMMQQLYRDNDEIAKLEAGQRYSGISNKHHHYNTSRTHQLPTQVDLYPSMVHNAEEEEEEGKEEEVYAHNDTYYSSSVGSYQSIGGAGLAGADCAYNDPEVADEEEISIGDITFFHTPSSAAVSAAAVEEEKNYSLNDIHRQDVDTMSNNVGNSPTGNTRPDCILM